MNKTCCLEKVVKMKLILNKYLLNKYLFAATSFLLSLNYAVRVVPTFLCRKSDFILVGTFAPERSVGEKATRG